MTVIAWDGKTISHEETERMPAEMAAKANADHLWSDMATRQTDWV